MRIGLDSVNHQAILNIVSQGHSIDGWLIIGYANGPASAWPPAAFDQMTQRGIQVARIDVLGNAWKEASILDVEKGDVQNPATITQWVRNRAQFRGDPIVYCNQSDLPMVVAAAAAAGVECGIWLAKPSNVPPLDPAAVGVRLPTNLYLAAVQFTQNQAAGGGTVDVSMWFRDDWHPELAAAGHPATMVNQAYTLAAAAAVDVSRETPAPPDPTPSDSPAPPPESSLPEPSPDPAPEPPPNSGSGSATPDPMPPRAEAVPGPTPTPFTPTPPPPADPGGVAGEIDNLIGKAKTGIGDLSDLLHSQSFHATAGRLENAVGEAIQLASLISRIPGL